MKDENGIPRILYWIMGALLMICTTGAAWTAASFTSRLTAVELSDRLTSERTMVNASKVEALEESLQRIEDKLDEALKERRIGGR
jgi:hypothetical protein